MPITWEIDLYDRQSKVDDGFYNHPHWISLPPLPPLRKRLEKKNVISYQLEERATILLCVKALNLSWTKMRWWLCPQICLALSMATIQKWVKAACESKRKFYFIERICMVGIEIRLALENVVVRGSIRLLSVKYAFGCPSDLTSPCDECDCNLTWLKWINILNWVIFSSMLIQALHTHSHDHLIW